MRKYISGVRVTVVGYDDLLAKHKTKRFSEIEYHHIKGIRKLKAQSEIIIFEGLALNKMLYCSLRSHE